MMKQGLLLARKPHIVIATPGRLADHLQSTDTVSLNKIKFLVGQQQQIAQTTTTEGQQQQTTTTNSDNKTMSFTYAFEGDG